MSNLGAPCVSTRRSRSRRGARRLGAPQSRGWAPPPGTPKRMLAGGFPAAHSAHTQHAHEEGKGHFLKVRSLNSQA